MRSLALLLTVSLAACAEGSLAPAEAPLEIGSIERDGARLLLSSRSSPAAQTDERPSYRLRVEGSATIEPDDRVLGAALVLGGAVWVTTSFELWSESGRIDVEALPELAVSADGRMVAYPHRVPERPGVYLIEGEGSEWSAPRCVTAGLAFADRPLFLPDGRLVVVGAVASGIAGVWIVDPRGGQPIALTNAGLRTGRPLGPSFVPPPAHHASMRVEGSSLVYDDGYGERRVELPGAR